MKLILPINNSCLTSSYQSKTYHNEFGFPHYGIDLVCTKGNRTVYASGDGTIIATGWDNVVGNTIVVFYPSAYCHTTGKESPLIIRYFHLSSIAVKENQAVNKDTVLGHYGSTGSFSTGPHLHLEVDEDIRYPLYTPTIASSSFLKGSRAGATARTMSNPLNWLYCKSSKPDYQSWSTRGTAFINKSDYNIPMLP